MLTVGELTEKWLYIELRVIVTPDMVGYVSEFTEFSIATDTVLVSFRFNVVGI